MSQISRTCAVISFLISLFLGSCNNIPSVIPEPQPFAASTPISSVPSIPAAKQEWFGMQISSDLWQAEEIQGVPYQHGLLTHRSLTGCRAWIMSEDPAYISGYTPDYNTSTLEQFKADEIRLDLRIMKDQDGSLRDTYFEVFDMTGRTGFEEFRLAYFLIEAGENPSQCVDAVYTLLLTLKPDFFPDLGTGQG